MSDVTEDKLQTSDEDWFERFKALLVIDAERCRELAALLVSAEVEAYELDGSYGMSEQVDAIVAMLESLGHIKDRVGYPGR
ncbi:hypothetical protein FHP25_24425 [Vineibacter terrae]|uniref:Uncharacterized protein n=1 Tax=Vineibacter terrae TaxID=2586908 RepID=A0A5C8PHC5_9HYPH|nr:hypothetical protein [Vineibacter terrae]TXL72699.1 hypothetical protein FHP25_24425 [Vineibacter terrae]